MIGPAGFMSAPKAKRKTAAVWKKPHQYICRRWHAFVGTVSVCQEIYIARDVERPTQATMPPKGVCPECRSIMDRVDSRHAGK